ncbi:MAG: hypothetical protein QXK42_02795 [Candidatus Korarchaeum sp.]
MSRNTSSKFPEEVSDAHTMRYVLAAMEDGEEWSPSSLRRHLAKRGVRRSYKAIHSALSRLLKEGKIERTRYGWYRLGSSRPTHGLADLRSSEGWLSNFGKPKEPRIHDIWLVAEGLPIVKHKEILTRSGNTEIRIILGEKRGKVTIVMKNDYPGLDYDAWCLSIQLVRLILEKELNWFDESAFIVKNVEFNVDVQGLRIDGISSLTLRSFEGWFARLYQKRENESRVEVREGDLGIAQVSAILQGGFSGAQALSYIASLNRSFTELVRLINAMLEGQRVLISMQRELIGRLNR